MVLMLRVVIRARDSGASPFDECRHQPTHTHIHTPPYLHAFFHITHWCMHPQPGAIKKKTQMEMYRVGILKITTSQPVTEWITNVSIVDCALIRRTKCIQIFTNSSHNTQLTFVHQCNAQHCHTSMQLAHSPKCV